jgi:hypothetical protein
MRIKHLKIRGFRGFNEEQPIGLSDPVSVFEGPNGSGKTSMGEAIEWLLYGKTLKRTKGEELSKREYAGCYKNIHFIGPGSAFVEADIEHSDGTSHVIRRELNSDESSVLQIDGKPAQSLRAFGVDTMYDRPLILQHTLQDFIFMKPKGRYEVLSSMLGLEPLIAFRNTLEAAKTDFSRRIPQKVREAESQRTLLLKEMRLEPVLVPAAILVEAANLADAKKHVLQVAQGLVPTRTEASDLPAALKAAKASKERTQLDWGRFSVSVITDPANTPAIRQLTALDDRLKKLWVHLAEAAETTAQAQPSAREPDGNRRQFYRLGLAFLSETHPANCPFCAADSLTPERAARLRSAVQDSPAGISALQQAVLEVRAFDTELKTHGSEVRRLIPKRPETADEQIITRIGGTAAEAFLESSRAVAAQLAEFSQASDSLNEVRSAIEAALITGTLPNKSDDFSDRLNAYATATRQLPGLLNGYAANYGILDPTIRAGLASASDVKKIERTVQVIERWREFEIAQEYRAVEAEFQELIRETRSFTETKQKSVLASRDKEIRDWYAMLNPVSDVGYDGIITSTDNLELRARTYSKPMMAAPNLSTSQLNCIGLAVYLACATRSGSPFKTLIIDDPVQSMDEEHNEAFKKQVIEKLVDMGYHIVLLTHMQLLAGDVESLYRNKGAALFKMRPYTRTGPSIEWKGPGIGRLLENVKAHKDAENDQYRMSATLDLRKFVERFAKELFKAQTGQLISKRYEDKTWSELKELLKRCKDFDPNDEPKLADTHSFTSRFLHSDERMPQDVPNSAQINSHYLEMCSLLDRYNTILGFQTGRAAASAPAPMPPIVPITDAAGGI